MTRMIMILADFWGWLSGATGDPPVKARRAFPKAPSELIKRGRLTFLYTPFHPSTIPRQNVTTLNAATLKGTRFGLWVMKLDENIY